MNAKRMILCMAALVVFRAGVLVPNTNAAGGPAGLANADLAVQVGALPPQLDEGSMLTIPVTVSNLGPDLATGVQLTFNIPAGAVLESVVPDQGTFDIQGSNVTCSVAGLAPMHSFNVQATFSVDPQYWGPADEEFFDWDWIFDVASPAVVDFIPSNNVARPHVVIVFRRDWGDAPDTYHTLKANNGARHRIRAGWRLGALIDPDPDGMPSANSDGDDFGDGNDDEDGVLFLAPIIPGLMTSNAIAITVPAGSNAFLNAWYDFNRDGNFAGAVEHVIADLPVTSGTVTQRFTVPLAAISGSTHARFRLSAVPGLTPTGFTSAGEVEDYGIECKPMDLGDLPDTYRTTKSADGARHLVTPQFYLGGNVDTEDDGVPSANAQGDDAAMPLGFDDEDGVSFPVLVPGFSSNITVVATTISGFSAHIDAWIDWNADGDFDDPGEKVFNSVSVMNGINNLPCAVPASATPGNTYARFRLSFGGGLDYFGFAPDGEVEDYRISIASGGVPDLTVNFGNLPDSSFSLAPLNYSVTVSNAGSTSATFTTLNINHEGILIAAPTATVSQGSYQVASNEVQCALGTLIPGASAVIQVTVTPGNQEALHIVAQAAANESDANPFNDIRDHFVFVPPLFSQPCACSCDTNVPWPSPDPLITSWFTKGSRQYARVQTNDGGGLQTVWLAVQAPGMGMPDTRTNVGPVYADIQKIQSDTDAVYVRSYGLASHVMGPWYCDLARTALFPNWPASLYETNRIPRNPIPNDAHPVTPLGAMGVWVNGTAIYNMLDGFSYHGPVAGDVQSPIRRTWNRDAWFSEHITFDPALYHQQKDGQYHAHANPLLLRFQLDDNLIATTNGQDITYSEATNNLHHSPILGWAWDGHPIYGPYGYSNPTNPASGIRRMVSGYVLRNGQYGTLNLTNTGRTTLPEWTRCANTNHLQIGSTNDYGPEPVGLDTSGKCNDIPWELGRYAEDYAYLGDIYLAPFYGAQWDLDRYNGRCCKTPEFPDGTYAYFVTLTESNTPAFPYIIGWQYCSQTNGGPVGTVPATATNVYTAWHLDALNGNFLKWIRSNSPIVLRWNSREGGSYRVQSSENLQDWAPITPSLVATGTVSSVNIDPGTPPPSRQFYRVEMQSDGAPSPDGEQ